MSDDIDNTAAMLFWKMEHLDPSGAYDWDKSREENWAALNEHEKGFYRAIVTYFRWHAPADGA